MFSEKNIARWARDFYALEAKVKPFPGYEEWNYLLTAAGGERFILKVSFGPEGILQAQAEMVDFLVQNGMKDVFPEHLLNAAGRPVTRINSEKGVCFLRVVKYLTGVFLAEKKQYPPRLLENFGRFLGKMDTVLKGFNQSDTYRYHDWDLQHALDWTPKLSLIPSHEDRRVAAYFLLQFEENVQPFTSSLRHAVIHNDANDWNVLFEGDHVSGLIDFGDVVFAPLINNLAIAVTYLMLDNADPLASAVSVVKGYHEKNHLTKQEVGLLYYLIAARLCISVLHTADQRAAGSGNPHHFITEKQAWALLHGLLKISPLKAEQDFRLACGMPGLYHEKDDYTVLLRERKKHIGPNLSISYKKNLKIIKGALQYLYDDKGHTFLDGVNNVSHVGHCHPRVVKAMQKQIATLNTNTRYLHDGLEEYANLLCSTLPAQLSVCYFVNSGSEANDLAIRMARNYTGQKDIIVLDHAYHGTSSLTIAMSPYKFDGKGGFSPPEYIHKAQSPDTYRGDFRYNDPLSGTKYAERVKKIVEDLSHKNKKPAAFICETLLGVGGQFPLPEGYLSAAYRHVRDAGGLCIADEVQVGFGRVGTAFWGFELQEVVPDIVVMGKPMGNGHPLAAVVVTKKVADAFNNGMEYFNTFGGNPVSMATGQTVLKVILEEGLQKNALDVGTYLLTRLKQLQKKYPILGDVRGRGLFIGVEFVKDRITLEPALEEIKETVEQMKERGFLLSTDGPLHNVLKIKPPLVFSKQNAADLTENLKDVLDKIDSKRTF